MNTRMRRSPAWLVAVILFALPLVAACEALLTRNADGSIGIQTTITQQQLQAVITSSLADPLVKSVNVSFQSGYVLVTGERQRLNDSSKTDTLSFRLDLAAQTGHLVATVSGAQIDGVPVAQNRVDSWNATIANRLEHLAQRRPNTIVQSISITPQSIIMDWQVSK